MNRFKNFGIFPFQKHCIIFYSIRNLIHYLASKISVWQKNLYILINYCIHDTILRTRYLQKIFLEMIIHYLNVMIGNF